MDPVVDRVDEGFVDEEFVPIEQPIYQCQFCLILLPYNRFPHRCIFRLNNDEGIDETYCLGLFVNWFMRNRRNPFFHFTFLDSDSCF